MAKTPSSWTAARVKVIVTVDKERTFWKETECEVRSDCPGLAIVPARTYGERSGYVVVHPPTGFLLFKNSTSRAKARKVVEIVAPLCDWRNGDKDYLRSNVNGPQLMASIKEAMGLLE